MTAILPLSIARSLQMAASATPLGYRAQSFSDRIAIFSVDSGAEVRSISLEEIQHLRLRGRGWVRELMDGIEAVPPAPVEASASEESPVVEEVPVAEEPAPVTPKKTSKRRSSISVVVGE